MKSESKLLGRSNISLGAFPLIAAIILSEITSVDYAVYMGTAIGLLLSIVYHTLRKPKATYFILYSSVIVLSIFSIIILLNEVQKEWLHKSLPFMLEIATILPLLLFYLFRKKYSLTSVKDEETKGIKDNIRTTILTVSYIRIFFALVTIHLVLIAIYLPMAVSIDNGFMWFLLHIVPGLVFVVSILIGFMEINILRTMKVPTFVPVVTSTGKVVGQVKDKEIMQQNASLMYPIIRIAIVEHNMLFLSKRPLQNALDKEQMDIPLETYFLFQEDIKSGVKRLLQEAFPDDWQKFNPRFSIKYYFKNDEMKRLVYLFVLDLGTDEAVLYNSKFECGKLWTFQQIEYNLGMDYFGEMFENEYEHLKFIIETRGKYKGF